MGHSHHHIIMMQDNYDYHIIRIQDDHDYVLNQVGLVVMPFSATYEGMEQAWVFGEVWGEVKRPMMVMMMMMMMMMTIATFPLVTFRFGTPWTFWPPQPQFCISVSSPSIGGNNYMNHNLI